MWGNIPNTAGQVFWVAPAAAYTVDGISYTASDSNDGLSPARAMLTLGAAITAATASVGDVIVLLPGAHSWAATAALSKAGLTIMGLPSGQGNARRHKTSVTTSASDEIFNVTAANIEIAYLHFITITAKAAVDLTAAADNLYIHNCSFDMFTAAANTATIGVGVTAIGNTARNVIISDCVFDIAGAQGPGVSLGDAQEAVVQDNVFSLRSGTLASACNVDGITSNTALVRRNYFYAHQATMSAGILGGTDDGSTSRVTIVGNFFSGAEIVLPVDGFGTLNAKIAENYLAGAGAAAGGVLWSSIT